jgi:hypothetical protein
MQVVSSTEFATRQSKVRRQPVFVRDNDYISKIVSEPIADEQPFLQPDDDLRNAITFDELREHTHKYIHELFAKK